MPLMVCVAYLTLWERKAIGFTQISVSHAVAPLIKLIGRGDTTVADAYLSPVLRNYVEGLEDALGAEVATLFMQSSGGLAPRAGGAEAVAGCGIVIECRIVQKQLLDLDTLDPDFRAKYYGDNQALPDGDPHVLYVGEVLAAYEV